MGKVRKISEQEALRAASVIDIARSRGEGYPNGFKESTKYDIEIRGLRYPPKAILGVALGLGPRDFSGGIGHAHAHLSQTGFPIFQKNRVAPQQPKSRGILFWASRSQNSHVSGRKETTEIRQKHVEMQQQLLRVFSQRYESKNVAIEWPIEYGRVDVALLQEQDVPLFEIKTATSPLACAKDALGQLMAYALCGGIVHYRIASLVIVGPSPIDDITEKFCTELSIRFNVSIRYCEIETLLRTSM